MIQFIQKLFISFLIYVSIISLYYRCSSYLFFIVTFSFSNKYSTQLNNYILEVSTKSETTKTSFVMMIYISIYSDNMVPVSRRRREWTELDGTAVSRRSVAQVRVNSGDPGRCPKIRLKEPGPNGTSAGFQTDENRYYTLILAEKAEKR